MHIITVIAGPLRDRSWFNVLVVVVVVVVVVDFDYDDDDAAVASRVGCRDQVDES